MQGCKTTNFKKKKKNIKIDINSFKIKYGEHTEKTSMIWYVSVAFAAVAFCLNMSQNLDVIWNNQHDVRKHISCECHLLITNFEMTQQSSLTVQAYVCMHKGTACH